MQVTSAFSRQLEVEAASVNNGMMVETCSEGGQDMGYIDQGDYLVWNSISIPTTSSYLIEYRVASPSGGTISADLNAGSAKFGNTTIPNTGGWQNWTTVSNTVTINAGTYNFGIYAQTAGFNLNWVRISKAGAARAAALAPAVEKADSPERLAALELYPNPVVGQLQLHAAQSLAGSQYRIFNAWGQPAAAGTTAGTVDVPALQPGAYTIQLLVAGRKPFVQRFVK